MAARPKKAPKRPRATARRQAEASPRDPVDAAIELFAAEGYGRVTMAAIAEAARLPLAELLRRYPGKPELLGAWIGRIDAAMLEGEPDPAEGARDRLFDVIMRRLDLLAPHKEFARSLRREVLADPVDLGRALAAAGRRSRRWMLAAAGIEAGGLGGMLLRRGLGLVYADTLRVWLDDPSPDAARTMAHLDRRLRQAEDLWNRLPRFTARRAEPGD